MEIHRLDPDTQKDIVGGQLFNSYTDVVHSVVYKVLSPTTTFVEVVYSGQRLLITYDGGTHFKDGLLECLETICHFAVETRELTTTLILTDIFVRFPVRHKLFKRNVVLKQLRDLMEGLGVVLWGVKLILKTLEPNKVLLLMDSKLSEEQAIIQRLSSLDYNHPSDISIVRTKAFTLFGYCSPLTKVKKIVCSVRQVEVECPDEIKSLVRRHLPKGYLVYLQLDLPEDMYEVFKRHLWIYNLGDVMGSLDGVLGKIKEQQMQQQVPDRLTLLRRRSNPESDEESDLVCKEKPTPKKQLIFEEKRKKIIEATETQEDRQDNSIVSSQNPFPEGTHRILISDFSQLQPLCQFFKGFIIAQLGSQLFMIDQHAASQKLFYETHLHPQAIPEMSSATLPSRHKYTLEKEKSQLEEEGWRWESKECDDEVLIEISQVPQFVNFKCGSKDFVARVVEGKDTFHQKIYKSIAKYACREAYKVGDILNYTQTKTILSSLSKISSPYNCPHGRPTVVSIGSSLSLAHKIPFRLSYQL